MSGHVDGPEALGGPMYRMNNDFESKVAEKLEAVENAISEARDRRSELDEAIDELENAENSLREVLEALENVNALTDISIEGFEVSFDTI